MEDNYPHASQARFALFGDRLGRALEAKSLTPADVSGRLRISTQMVGKYLRGESLPRPERLRELSELVGVNMGKLLEGVDVERQPRTPQAVRLLWNERALATPHDATQSDSSTFRLKFSGPQGFDRTGGREREPRPAEIIVDYLTEWAERELPSIRPGASIPQVQPNLKARYFSYRPDWCILGDTEPLLGVEIKSIVSSDILPAIAGIAEQWKRATNGAPFIVVLVNSFLNFRSSGVPNSLEQMRADKLIEDFRIIDCSTDRVVPREELDALCEQIRHALLIR